jgi:hypothetical protein
MEAHVYLTIRQTYIVALLPANETALRPGEPLSLDVGVLHEAIERLRSSLRSEPRHTFPLYVLIRYLMRSAVADGGE